MNPWRSVIRIAFLLGCAACALGGTPMRSAAGDSIDWPSYNNDLESDRYSSLSQISTSNVGTLHVACTAPLGAAQTLESGPIEVAGTMYVTTSQTTMAFNATTCAPLWSTTYTPKVGGNNRGAAYANGMLFRGFGDGHVVALNAATGAVVWNESVIAAGSYETITAAPIVWHGTLYIGTANSEYGPVCHVMALNAANGAVVWSQQTVPNLGTALAATWAGATHIGGGGTWSSFTIDQLNNSLYVPVGNPAPDYDTRKRLGMNLDTNAVLDFNPETGYVRETLQFEPQDDHDWDQAATPAVVSLTNGERVALAAGKDGILRSVDLTTLTQKWATPVTTIANASAPITTSGTHFCPVGGVFWNGPAYSPETGLSYVNAVDWCQTVYGEATPAPYVPGKSWLGDARAVTDAAQSGWLNAVNALTGVSVWRYHSTAPLIAGVTPTAGGLVFTGDLLGNILAFNAGSGNILASVPTGLPVGGGVITYEVNGTQYVAAVAGITSDLFQKTSVKPALVILHL